MMYGEMIDKYIEDNKDRMIDALSRLVGVKSVEGTPSESKPFGDGPAEALFEAENILNSLGFKTHNHENYMLTSDLYEGKGSPKLGIIAHLDVVPEGSGWTHDPYKLYIDEENGLLFGRGAIDDKGPAVSAIFALKAIKDLGIKLENNVRLMLGTNEESGFKDLEYYSKKCGLPEFLLTPDAEFPVVNVEKGVSQIKARCGYKESCGGRRVLSLKGGTVVNAVPDRASAVVSGFSLGEIKESAKRLGVSVKFEVSETGENVLINASGKAAHGSLPELGDNAVTALIKLLCSLELDDNGESRLLRLLNRLFPYGENDGSSVNIACRDEISGKLTLTFSVINMENGVLSFMADIRFPVCTSLDNIYKGLDKSFEKSGIAYTDDKAMEPHYVDKNSDFIKTLLSVYKEVTGIDGECVCEGGATYLHNTDMGVAFGAEFPGESNNMHGADEHIKIDSFLRIAKIYARAVIKLCMKED